MRKTKRMKFMLITYDLISDGEGMSVNDVYPHGILEVYARLTTYNEGTEYEHQDYAITDRQLNRMVGGRGLTWEGELEYTLYATDKRGNPACELRRVGH